MNIDTKKTTHPLVNNELEVALGSSLQKGFSKGVNEYLNHYVNVGAAKAAAFLSLSFVVIQFLIKDHFLIAWGFSFYWAALGFLSLSILVASAVLFPRLCGGSKGLIFGYLFMNVKAPRNMKRNWKDGRIITGING